MLHHIRDFNEATVKNSDVSAPQHGLYYKDTFPTGAEKKAAHGLEISWKCQIGICVFFDWSVDFRLRAAIPSEAMAASNSTVGTRISKYGSPRRNLRPPNKNYKITGGFFYPCQKRSFVPPCPATRQINCLDWTKTHGKTFAVLAGFCHSEV